MKRMAITAAWTGLMLGLLLCANSDAQGPIRAWMDTPFSPETRVVDDSTVVLQELATHSLTPIPTQLLQEASGIAIVPRYFGGAFVVGVAGGRGLLLVRDADGQWSPPEFITLTGGSVGWQAGIQATDLVLVLRTPRSLANIRRGKLTLGADASAAAGPVGRYAGAATDTSLQAEILTYSRSRGLFAGVSLNGAVLQMDRVATERFYRPVGTPAQTVPPAAQTLIAELNRWSNANRSVADEGASRAQYIRPDNNESVVRLEQAVRSLQTKVNARWADYLALPRPEPDTGDVSPEAWLEMGRRYERIQAGPEYEALRVQPEFQSALRILRSFSDDATNAEIVLPPPPAATSSSRP